LGGILVLIGIGIVFQEQVRADVPLLSLGILVLAAVSGALSGIVIKRFPKSHLVSTNAVAMVVGAALLLAISRGAGESWNLPTLPEIWEALAWLIVSAIVAFILTIWLLSKWKASAVAYSTVLVPLVIVVVASLLAGEQVTLLFVIGGVFALGGVYYGALADQTDPEPTKWVGDKLMSEISPT
jgi:drug/metabolite transporter (DMT)-like permease